MIHTLKMNKSLHLITTKREKRQNTNKGLGGGGESHASLIPLPPASLITLCSSFVSRYICICKVDFSGAFTHRPLFLRGSSTQTKPCTLQSFINSIFGPGVTHGRWNMIYSYTVFLCKSTEKVALYQISHKLVLIGIRGLVHSWTWPKSWKVTRASQALFVYQTAWVQQNKVTRETKFYTLRSVWFSGKCRIFC